MNNSFSCHVEWEVVPNNKQAKLYKERFRENNSNTTFTLNHLITNSYRKHVNMLFKDDVNQIYLIYPTVWTVPWKSG